MRIAFFGVSGALGAPGDGNVSFAVELDERTVLVDCSGSPASQLAAVGCDLTELDVLVLTHAHTDHLYALPSLIHSAWIAGRTKPLPIISNHATREQAQRLLGVFGLPEKSGMFRFDWITTEEGSYRLSESGGSELRWFPVLHGVPTIGLAIREGAVRVVYSGDTAPSEAVLEAARGCDLLIHECSGAFDDEARLRQQGHTSAEQAGRLAREAGAARAALVHLPATGWEALRDEAAEAFGKPVEILARGCWITILADSE